MKNAIAKLFDKTTLSASQISKLVEWLQITPKTTTIRVNLLQTSIDNVMAHVLETLEKCDYLPSLPLVQRFGPLPEVIMIHSIEELQPITQPYSELKEVIIDLSCAAAVLRGAHIYCPGILAMQSNTKIGEIVNIFADIEGTCKNGTKIYMSTHKLFVGIGQVKMQRFMLFRSDSKGIAVRVHKTISCVPSIGSDYLIDQQSLLQNFPSIVCSRVLDPKPNEIILDMCASPGNKTTHIAQLMRDCGHLIALDKSKRRISILKENIMRFKLKSVRCFTFDATKASTKLCKTDCSPPFTEESFDRILLDAPCSGLGNRPVLSTNITSNVLSSFPKLQKKLLDTAVKLLKVNGILVYSTCSVMEVENEMNVAYILEKYGSQIELETASPLFGYNGLPNMGLNEVQRRMVQRFGPNLEEVDNQTDMIDSTGFFICKFRKKSKST